MSCVYLPIRSDRSVYCDLKSLGPIALLKTLDDLLGQEATPHTKNNLLEIWTTSSDGGDGQEDTGVEGKGCAEVCESEGPGTFFHRAI